MTHTEKYQQEILKKKQIWESKKLLRIIYTSFYHQITQLIDTTLEGKIVELGSGIGNLKSTIHQAICTTCFLIHGLT